MFAATLALNGWIRTGVPEDWSTHMIGHELTSNYGLDHAQTLVVILPNVMEVKKANKREKLLQYAERIWNINEGSEDERITQVIAKTREFFESVGVKTRLADYHVVADVYPINLKLLV